MTLKPSAQKVQDWLSTRGLSHQVREMPDTTRTSEEAAAACGCTVGQIGKSLIFRIKDTEKAVLVIASGANRVDEKAVAHLLSEDADAKVKLGRADAEFVRATTGFAIGGVPPVAHPAPLITLIDRDLLEHPSIWCTAGTPNAVFELTPDELVSLTGGTVAEIRKG